MPTQKYIESLHIEDNVFELSNETVLGYLAHYYAPFTGGGEISVPSGLKFAASGPMRGQIHKYDFYNRIGERKLSLIENYVNGLAFNSWN